MKSSTLKIKNYDVISNEEIDIEKAIYTSIDGSLFSNFKIRKVIYILKVSKCNFECILNRKTKKIHFMKLSKIVMLRRRRLLEVGGGK